MRLLISLLAFSCLLPAQQFGYSVLNQDSGAWKEILSSIGLLEKSAAEASVFVARSGTAASQGWEHRLKSGNYLILEGDSPLARVFGFRQLDRLTRFTSVLDVHQPELPLIFEQALEVTEPAVPGTARVFARDRWTGVPAIAGFRVGKGAVLWLAGSPGKHGYERFPFLLNALCDLGFAPPFRGNRLWAFFDYAYRARADVDWFAKRWHASGIAALHVAAWHFYDSDPERDRYLDALIRACHREGVLVYAWLELPHISERFWTDHPEWREQTALQQDAQLDWRKLMNLADPACSRAVRLGVTSLMKRFDWDGINFAELYYESLEGASNPARFTPMNQTVRRNFAALPGGFDPIELWSTRKDRESLRRFLDYRAELARGLQDEWLSLAAECQTFQPSLDVVLTHVDDRLDTGMRDAIGADTSRLPALLNAGKFTFLLEDPATVWDQGPQRYPLIASKYPASSRLAIDINVVDRYQNVYPTKRQTGLELFGLIHLASASFTRVALYIENSLSASDLQLLPSVSSGVQQAAWIDSHLILTAGESLGLVWSGPAKVDGQDWPAREDGVLLLPPGNHKIEPGKVDRHFQVLSLTGTLLSAEYRDHAIALDYGADARAIVRFSEPLARLSLDNQDLPLSPKTSWALLPKGKHSVIAWPQTDESGSRSGRNSGKALFPYRRSQQAAGN